MFTYYGVICLVWICVLYTSYVTLKHVGTRSVSNTCRVITAIFILGGFSSAAGATALMTKIYDLSGGQIALIH